MAIKPVKVSQLNSYIKRICLLYTSYPAAILCVSFLGFDAVSTLSEEAKNPAKDIPKAMVLVCLGAGLLFTLIAYIAQVMWLSLIHISICEASCGRSAAGNT